jgi:Argonaute linker 1 domain
MTTLWCGHDVIVYYAAHSSFTLLALPSRWAVVLRWFPTNQAIMCCSVDTSSVVRFVVRFQTMAQGHGVLSRQVWLGYQQSLRACEMGLTLNVDVASTAFIEPQPVPSPALSLSAILLECIRMHVVLHRQPCAAEGSCSEGLCAAGPNAAGTCGRDARGHAEQWSLWPSAPCSQQSCVRPQGEAYTWRRLSSLQLLSSLSCIPAASCVYQCL